jgi:hypothetical protein
VVREESGSREAGGGHAKDPGSAHRHLCRLLRCQLLSQRRVKLGCRSLRDLYHLLQTHSEWQG